MASMETEAPLGDAQQQNEDQQRIAALDDYKRKLLQHKELDARVRSLREEVKKANAEYDKTEDDLRALQSVGQIIGEVLRQLDEERCTTMIFHLPFFDRERERVLVSRGGL